MAYSFPDSYIFLVIRFFYTIMIDCDIIARRLEGLHLVDNVILDLVLSITWRFKETFIYFKINALRTHIVSRVRIYLGYARIILD